MTPADSAPLLDLDALERRLDDAGLGSGPVRAEMIGEGLSNYTFLIGRGPNAWILRRPPRPPFPPSTHDVLREHQILAACVNQPAQMPRPVLVVADLDVLGVPFFLMEYIAGEVMSTQLPPAAQGQEQRIAEELVAGLADIHAVDWRACGLEWLDRPGLYVGRQLKRFNGLWDSYRSRPIPEIDEASRRLAERTPTGGPRTLVHGDYRLGNTIFSLDVPARLLAVLDWEMAAVGDPLADVGYMLATWAEPNDATGPLLELGAATACGGFPARGELAEMYAAKTSRSLDALPWYEALACWKTAILFEGSYQRFLSGTSSDPYFERLETGVRELAAQALRALDRAGH